MELKSYKHLYESCFRNRKDFLHFAAHSHHPWPDCTLVAHEQYWKDSVQWLDEKWDKTFGEVITLVQKNIAKTLNLSEPKQIAIAPNTHEFVVRLLSCLDLTCEIKILTTDSEFHSFQRQILRLKELPNVQVEAVGLEPYESFEQRWCEKIKSEEYDFIFTSQVFFNSGLECVPFEKWIPLVDKKTIIAIDGYHAFCAVPTDLKPWQERIFYLAGGYKYAQAGEGICFMSVPCKNNLRPQNTGWFADFSALTKSNDKKINYATDGMQFAGSTFDASGCYRLNSVFKMFSEQKIFVFDIHERVMTLKKYFISKIKEASLKNFRFADIIQQNSQMTSAHFVTFRTTWAQDLEHKLKQKGVVVDFRADRLRFGFGIYHDIDDIDLLVSKMETIE